MRTNYYAQNWKEVIQMGMRNAIIALIMLMCCFPLAKAQESILTQKEINDIVFYATGWNFNGTSSSDSQEQGEDNQIYTVTEKIAEFPGGINALFDFINKNLTYPKECISNNIEGKIMLKIIVEKDGRISSAKVSESSADKHSALIREALRLASIMPKWIPAEYRGNNLEFKKVRNEIYIPILFRLRDGKYLPLSHINSTPKKAPNRNRPSSFISFDTFENQLLPHMSKPLILFFYLDYCKPCYDLYEDWDILFSEYKNDYQLYYVLVDSENKDTELWESKFGMHSYPYVVLFYNRKGGHLDTKGYIRSDKQIIQDWFKESMQYAKSHFE